MKQEQHIPVRRHTRRHTPRSILRRVFGWSVIVLGMFGVVLPVLPGFIFIGLGIVLLGPHDPTLRRIAILIRLILRRWSQAKQRHIRRIGQHVRRFYREKRLQLRAYLHDHAHDDHSWRGHYMLLALTLVALAISAGIGFIVWHTIL